LNKQKRAALDAIAKNFSAIWEGNPAAPCFAVAGKRVDLDVRTLKQRGDGQKKAGRVRLRFDKVVVRLLDQLQATLAKAVPDGMTVFLTVTAPIRLPSKTAAALEEKIQLLLQRGSHSRAVKDSIYGNRVQIQLLNHAIRRTPKLMGFVHNPDTDPHLLLNMTRAWIELVSVDVGKRAARSTGDRWLVVISDGEISNLEPHRYIYSQLRLASDFTKSLMVFGDGRVEVLGE
jgi:hypothetical protein